MYFTPCQILVQELLAAKASLFLPQKLKQLGRYDAIIIDDIGYVHQNRDEMEVLFTLLAHRYERGSVMITSNLPSQGSYEQIRAALPIVLRLPLIRVTTVVTANEAP